MTRLILLLLLMCSMGASLFAQDEPQDLLPADFHLGRREALRKLLPPKGVAVFFANPVRNRSNDVGDKPVRHCKCRVKIYGDINIVCHCK